MAEIYEWKSAVEVIEMLKELNLMVSGMSNIEAAAATLGFTKTFNGMYMKTVVTEAVQSISGSTAAQVAPVAVAAAPTATNLVLFETGTGAVQVGGVASLALPVAAAVLASVGGYLIGNQIYEANSSFLDELMFPLYDFLSGNNVVGMEESVPSTPTMPVIFDESGHTFMNSLPCNAMKELFYPSINSLPMPTTDGVTIADFNYSRMTPAMKAAMYKYKYYAIYYEKDMRHYEMRLFESRPSVDIAHNGSRVMAYFVPGAVMKHALCCYSKDYGWEVFDEMEDATSYASRWFETPSGKVMNDIFIANNVTINYVTLSGAIGTNWEPLPLLGTNWSFLTRDYAGVFPGGGDLPAEIVKYVPGSLTGILPIKFPSLANWVPVVLPLPAIEPGKMPEPVQVPDALPVDYPIRIEPYINPDQPQPIDAPIKRPTTVPAIPRMPVPNPNKEGPLQPQLLPDPTKDPSQVLDTEPLPKPIQVPLTEPTLTDTGGASQPFLPITPTISLPDAGLLHVYNPTPTQISQFGSWLWTTFSGDLLDTLSKLFNNPMDAVIGLHELYATPITAPEVSSIKAGYLDSGVASRLVSSRYVEIKCGALSVPEFWNNYLDYSPYTKTYCYLPFIGIVELNADDIIGSGVEITYKIDTYNGSCIALITTAKSGSGESVTYEFPGNCAVELPITSGMKSSIQGALLGAATVGFAAATGGAGAPLAAAAVGGVQGGSAKNLVQHSGSFGSSYGAMGIKIPFIIVKRPKQKVVPGYNNTYGYPSHKMVRISECSGFLKAIEVDVASTTATENEKQLIEKQLKSGIFVS